MRINEIHKLKKKANRLESEIWDMERDLEDSRNELETMEYLLEQLEAEEIMGVGDAFKTETGILGVVLYQVENLYRVALRLWNGCYVEDWINPVEFSGKPLEDALSHKTYCEFRAAGAV